MAVQDVQTGLALAFGGAGLTALLANEVGGGGRPLMHRARTAVIAFQTNSSEVNLEHSRQRLSAVRNPDNAALPCRRHGPAH